MKRLLRSPIGWFIMALSFAACSAATAPTRTGAAPRSTAVAPQTAAVAPPAPSEAPAKRGEGPSLRRQTVAVLPFSNDGTSGHERLDFLRDWLPDTIGAALGSSGELRVIERRELLRVLQEQKLGSSDLASKETKLRLGKMAGAQTLVFGGFAAIGDTIQVNARIVDVESGVILKSTSARGDVASARELGQRVSNDLAQNLGISVARAVSAVGVTGERQLAEAELFYQGVAKERQGDTDGAIESFKNALQMDPNDAEARRHLLKLLGPSD